MPANVGKVIQIIGPVIDIKFQSECLPNILNAIEIEIEDGKKIIAEVEQHVGDDIIRAIAMEDRKSVV